MKATLFLIASMATVFGAMASPAPMAMGVEVVRSENGMTMVREVARALSPESCTNCVDVGNACIIGEGNCKKSQHASCTECSPTRVICVSSFGNCDAP